MQYRFVSPDTNSPSGFTSNDLVTFIVPLDKASDLVKGSMYISGQLTVLKTGAVPVTSADAVEYDSQAGIHGFIENIVTSVNTGAGDSLRENISQYASYAHAFVEANQHFLTQALQNSASMELRCGQDTYTSQVLIGQRLADNSASTGINSFAFAPLICMNRTAKDVCGGVVQSIRIQIQLKNISQIFYNPNAVAGLTYNISDLRLYYGTVPTVSDMSPNQFTRIMCTKTSINSSFVTLSYAPPANVLAVSLNFNASGSPKPWTTDQIPNVSRVEFSVGGADYTLKFPLTSEEEVVLNYIKSLNYAMSESNAIYANLLGRGYGIGLNYLGPVDFRRNRMGISIQSTIAPTTLYTTQVFHTCIDQI
jgi:hypothetical protein